MNVLPQHPCSPHPCFTHPRFTRRRMIQAGAVGILGLGMAELDLLRAQEAAHPARRVIYIFLSGGLTQHESFDPKPDAPDTIRGEFQPAATRTPGVHITEHLPLLAARSDKWAIVRSLTHPSNGHSEGHHIMLTGRTPLPVGFDGNRPRPGDFPAIAAVANYATRSRNNLPPAVVLPMTLVHRTGRVIPGQFAGEMGARWDPWVIKAHRDCGDAVYGACPSCFKHERTPHTHPPELTFQVPYLSLPEGLSVGRLEDRRGLLTMLDRQRQGLDAVAETESLARQRQQAMSILNDPRTQQAFDVTRAAPAVLDRYGRNLFGYSCLMARQLVEAGVNLVQVNLGNNETWDTHQAMFPNLREHLLPHLDRCLTALIDDLEQRGLLDSTLIVMAGEFGRTPRISTLAGVRLPGRDHWGAVQSVFFAGGGVRGGTVIGSSDRNGAYPATSPQTPENMAATIYSALGIPPTMAWHDPARRPHFIYQGEPISGLMG
ncbi:MAG: DUF1501 domain-containing protein [Gemmataceae bacterium]